MTVQIIIMAACLLMSAYFSATETAFSTASKTKLKTLVEKDNKRAAYPVPYFFKGFIHSFSGSFLQKGHKGTNTYSTIYSIRTLHKNQDICGKNVKKMLT